MSTPNEPTISPSEQIRQRLISLQNAGIEWLGESPPLPEAATMNLFSELEELPPPDDAEDRRHGLEVLAGPIRECTKCSELALSRTQTVFGVGPIDPDLCFIGEAPGADEDRLGEPFVGAAGQMLNRIIMACGMKREEVYICNILKCRPPNNRTPKPDECSNCREFLERQISLVRPKFICALGLTAAANLLQSTSTLGKMRGKFHDFKGIPVLVTYHPASLLPTRNPLWKKDVWEDMKILLAKMGKPIPKGAAPKSE